MIVRILEALGRDRAFELLEFLILFFALVSVTTLGLLLAYEIRSRRALRRANRRLEQMVTYLGRNVFGEYGWSALEQTVAANGSRLDSLLSLFDPASFETWAREATSAGLMEASRVEELRGRFARALESHGLSDAESDVSECIPTSGTPVAVRQSGVQARGTIAEVGQTTFTIWILDSADGLDVEKPATFVLLSRSGPYRFEAQIEHVEDGSVIAKRPPRIVRTQRRRFGRRAAALSATVKEYLGDDPPYEAVISELSGGGATLTNPGGIFSLGSVLTLSFTAGRREYTVTGRVVRISGDEGQLHVRFEAMKDQQREEIAETVALTNLM